MAAAEDVPAVAAAVEVASLFSRDSAALVADWAASSAESAAWVMASVIDWIGSGDDVMGDSGIAGIASTGGGGGVTIASGGGEEEEEEGKEKSTAAGAFF